VHLRWDRALKCADFNQTQAGKRVAVFFSASYTEFIGYIPVGRSLVSNLKQYSSIVANINHPPHNWCKHPEALLFVWKGVKQKSILNFLLLLLLLLLLLFFLIALEQLVRWLHGTNCFRASHYKLISLLLGKKQ